VVVKPTYISMKNFLIQKYKVILFHLCLWSTWLYLPLSLAHEEELYPRAILMLTLIFLTHIPLFLFNTEYLIPRVLKPKGVTVYVWSLLFSMAVFIVFHNFVRDGVNTYLVQLGPSRSSFVKGTVAIILVGAISTGFGLLNYVAAQEKIQAEKVKERLQSELSFLRTQISPHFIFNILNSIVYLIRSKSDLAEPITIKLSEIIRYMLYISERVEVPLEKELGYLESYIDLQKVRFGNDVAIRFQETGNASGQMIEPMILIPFVENAFKHGIGMVADPIIEMDLRIEGNKLSFSVKNKITPEPASDKSEGSGIGLRNVQRRLELLYPDAHQLDIRDENGWFWIQLTLTLPEAA